MTSDYLRTGENWGSVRRYLRSARARDHLALEKDARDQRPVEPREQGDVVAMPQVGGLHHRYLRRAD